MSQEEPQKHKLLQKIECNKSNNRNTNSQKIQKYEHLSKEQLIYRLYNAEEQNKKLNNRLIDHEPFKQKKIRTPKIEKLKYMFQQYEVQKYAFKVCYIGWNYDGMAYQQQYGNSIQHFIFKALYALSLIPEETPGDQYTRAGRTDKGVSAMGNIICLPLRTSKMKDKSISTIKPIAYCKMMNSILPEDIQMVGCQQVSNQFNARYWCIKRSYKYLFCLNNLNLLKMKEAIQYFQGKHNFINFCKINLTNTINFQKIIYKTEIKSIQTNLYENISNQIYYFYFQGNSFLWHQIRFMVSILFLIGSGKQQPIIIKQLLNIQKYPTKPNYSMAIQYPLILENCQYPNLHFKPQKQVINLFYDKQITHQYSFNKMLMKKSIEQTLIINCMLLAKNSLKQQANLNHSQYIKILQQKNIKKISLKNKCLSMHKPSAKSLQQTIKNLKGKKKQLYQKKQHKQNQYEQKRKKKQQQQQFQQQLQQ